jgi:hypothetical protein
MNDKKESIWNTCSIDELIALNEAMKMEFPVNDGIILFVPAS